MERFRIVFESFLLLLEEMAMFEKNKDFFKQDEIEKLENTKIAVIGTGALGQMVAHTLVRSGIKNMLLMDFDQMEYSNFNRQLYAKMSTLGAYKAEVLAEELRDIVPELSVDVYVERLDKMNGIERIHDCDILVDCVDHVPAKLYMEQLAEQLEIPLIHGAVEGWYGQVATIFPGDKILHMLYQKEKEQKVSALMPTVNMVASVQAMEVIKIVTCHKEILRHRILFMDLQMNDYSYINIFQEE